MADFLTDRAAFLDISDPIQILCPDHERIDPFSLPSTVQCWPSQVPASCLHSHIHRCALLRNFDCYNYLRVQACCSFLGQDNSRNLYECWDLFLRQCILQRRVGSDGHGPAGSRYRQAAVSQEDENRVGLSIFRWNNVSPRVRLLLHPRMLLMRFLSATVASVVRFFTLQQGGKTQDISCKKFSLISYSYPPPDL